MKVWKFISKLRRNPLDLVNKHTIVELLSQFLSILWFHFQLEQQQFAYNITFELFKQKGLYIVLRKFLGCCCLSFTVWAYLLQCKIDSFKNSKSASQHVAFTRLGVCPAICLSQANSNYLRKFSTINKKTCFLKQVLKCAQIKHFVPITMSP